MPTLIERPEDLTVRVVGPIELSPALVESLRANRECVLSALSAGDPVYGVNTGMGAMSKRRLDESEQRVHQRNLLLGRAAGGAPWLPYAEARAVLIARLRTFLTGDAGVSPDLCRQLVALLNSGYVPAIPVGGAGSAGEIIPLAHAFGPLIGIGTLLDPHGNAHPAARLRPAEGGAEGTLRPAPDPGSAEGSAYSAADPGSAEGGAVGNAHPTADRPAEGNAHPTADLRPAEGAAVDSVRPAADLRSAEGGGGLGGPLSTDHLLAVGGVDPGFELGPKEGIALLAGVPGATGRAWLQVELLERLVDRMGEAAAGAIAVVGANRDPYDPRVGRADELLAAEQARILQLAGTEMSPGALQAPVSFRVAGHVVSHVRRTVARLSDAVDRGLDGVTDSPAFLEGEFLGTAGFHGIDLAAHCDQVVAALTHAAEVSTARIHRLLDPAVTGLPAQLARVPGPQAGLVSVHKRAVATSHALRRLSLPAAIGAMETSNGQEDVQSFSWEAAGGLIEAVRLTREVVAGELLAVHQAFALSDRAVPEGLRELFDAIAGVVPPIEADRPFGVDLQRILDDVL